MRDYIRQLTLYTLRGDYPETSYRIVYQQISPDTEARRHFELMRRRSATKPYVMEADDVSRLEKYLLFQKKPLFLN